MVENHARVKGKTDQWDVNVTEYKMFINMGSDSTVQLTFKKLPVTFGIIFKNDHNYLKRLLTYSSLF